MNEWVRKYIRRLVCNHSYYLDYTMGHVRVCRHCGKEDK